MRASQPQTQWSREQADAIDLIASWLKKKDEQVFRLFGYAGTGKTELAKAVASMIDDTVLYASYTGKASLVPSRRVGQPASTIHRLIYEPKEIDENGRTRTIWVLSEDSPLADAALLVVDEVSMVNEEMARDLLSFGVPMLVLGDPFQLPPIRRTGFFTSAEPDAMLTEVHRHGGPVLELATAVREGRPWRDEPNVITEEPEDLSPYDVIVCGTHRTRQRVNAFMRRGLRSDLEPGEKVICVRNDYHVGIFNGQTFTVFRSPEVVDGRLTLDIEDDEGEKLAVTAPHEDLWANECLGLVNGRHAHRRMACLMYGYAITAHKAQGSQWDRVLVIDESSVFKESDRWLYTAITRGAEDVTVVTAPLALSEHPDGYWD